jgi:C-terminal processing protease CtpA/Prc
MKYKVIKVIFIAYIACVTISCHSQSKSREYFVHPCKFVCDYPFNDTTKWAITCRVWGLLKYYHPNVTAGKLDWDEILLDRLDDIHLSSTPEMLNAELKKMLDEAGEYSYEKEEDWNDSLNMNVNLCWLDNSFLDHTLQDELKKIASLSVKYPSYYSLDFDTTMRLFMPQHEKAYNFDINTLPEYRLLTLFRYWNVIYYYFPHKYLMDKSWDETLTESIFPFINATDEQHYKIAFLKLAASLNDGHGYTNIEKGYPNESQDIIELVEGETVVKIDKGGLNKGDIVNGVGERDIDYIRDSLSVLIPASTKGNKEYRINCYVAEMIFFHETDVTILRKDQKLTVHMFPSFPDLFEKKNPSPHRWISNDIGYVDLSLLTTEEMNLIFQSFADMKGIIFDLRKTGPYEFSVDLFSRLMSDQKTCLFPMVIWVLEHPGTFAWWMTETLPCNDVRTTRIKGRIVFLINENSQSALETKAWVARTNYNAILIGRPTSGALGQVIQIPLPGNQIAFFSGVGLFSLDGTELQRKGIIPDIEVYPTLETIREGKDEILEAAIEYLNKN